MSPEACGKAKELSQRILDKGLPSVEDMRDKLASCQDDSCRKGVWTEYRQASDATINTLKQMALNGEDYGQQSTHKQIGLGADGRAEPHEHKFEYNDKGQPIGKYYRQIDKNGKPVGKWISEKK